MSSESYNYPVAVARFADGERPREPQNARTARRLLAQPGGQLVMATPRREVDSPILNQLVADPNVRHIIWRGLVIGALLERVLHAWPNREHLQELRRQDLDALAVIELNDGEGSQWIDDANPVQLFANRTVAPAASRGGVECEPLPNGVDGILEYVAAMAAGYSNGLEWNEEGSSR